MEQEESDKEGELKDRIGERLLVASFEMNNKKTILALINVLKEKAGVEGSVSAPYILTHMAHEGCGG